MTQETSRSDFNISILSNALKSKLDTTMEALAAKPDLLVKCIQFSDSSGNALRRNFSDAENKFLTEQKVVNFFIDPMSDYMDDVYMGGFQAPWVSIFKQLQAEMNNYTVPRKPILG